MKGLLFFTSPLLLSLPLFAMNAHAAPTGCAAKEAAIENEMHYAREHGNTSRLAGLRTALEEVKAHCTESGLLAERQQHVADKQYKVSERERELAEAKADGRAKKISKSEKKLSEAREELKEAEAALQH